MEKYYNIGLIPKHKNDEVIAYAKLLEPIADTYVLGNRSYPHVTLYQFVVDEEVITRIWNELKNISYCSIRL